MNTIIPADIMAELDKMPNLSSESTPSKKKMDESDDCIEIIDSPQVTPLKISETLDAKVQTNCHEEVVEIDWGPDLLTKVKRDLPKADAVGSNIVTDVYKNAFKNLDITVVKKKEEKPVEVSSKSLPQNHKETATKTKVATEDKGEKPMQKSMKST